MLSIYINNDSVIPQNVHDAIGDMQAIFGVKNRHTVPFEEIIKFISDNSGEKIASQVKAEYFLKETIAPLKP